MGFNSVFKGLKGVVINAEDLKKMKQMTRAERVAVIA